MASLKLNSKVIATQTGADNPVFASSNFTGMIAPFAMSTAPSGWLTCDGSAVSRSTHSNLFSAIGTTWGIGDGSTTFNVPDLRGAFLRGTGTHGTVNMADGNDFAGPSVGSFENDQVQGHHHGTNMWSGTGGIANKASSTTRYIAGEASTTAYLYRDTFNAVNTVIVDDPIDGDNGTVRDGDETRPFNAGIYYCIKN